MWTENVGWSDFRSWFDGRIVRDGDVDLRDFLSDIRRALVDAL